MRCLSCQKEIPNDSAFCLHCGARIENHSAEGKRFNYEFAEYVKLIGGKGTYGKLHSRESIANDYWRDYQSVILPEIQMWLDEGWQAISEVGPSAFVIREEPLGFLTLVFDNASYDLQRNVHVTRFQVKMRCNQRDGSSINTPKRSTHIRLPGMLLLDEEDENIFITSEIISISKTVIPIERVQSVAFEETARLKHGRVVIKMKSGGSQSFVSQDRSLAQRTVQAINKAIHL